MIEESKLRRIIRDEIQRFIEETTEIDYTQDGMPDSYKIDGILYNRWLKRLAAIGG